MTQQRVLLINPPWCSLSTPSIALEQLASVIRERRDLECAVDVRYLTHDFGQWLGAETYESISGSMESHTASFGEWFFRSAAFPNEPDNWPQYRKRYIHRLPPAHRAAVDQLVASRPRVLEWLQQWLSKLPIDEYLVVGLTTMFQQNTASLAIARLIKALRPDLPIVLGGANCEGAMGVEMVHACPDLDFVSGGHALRSFPQLVEALRANDNAAAQRCDGLYTRSNTRPSSATGGEPAFETIAEVGAERPLDEIVVPDYAEFLSSYETNFPGSKARPMIFFETSRGCWWGQRAHCTFCGLNGGTMAYRAMKPAVARDHIENLISRYSHRIGQLFAVDNILPKEYVDELFGDFRSADGPTIFYEVKADLGRSSLCTLARAGVKDLQPGIEALYTPTLKLMRKGTTSMHNVSFLHDCRQLNVMARWNLLVGFPGETAESYKHYQKALPNLHHLTPPSGAFPVRFDRFSPYFDKADMYGLKLEPLDYYQAVYPFDPSVIKHIAYYFHDRNALADYARTVAEWVGPLGQLVTAWKVRHNGEDGKPPARLDSVRSPEGRWNIVDRRFGYTTRWSANAVASTLIDQLQRPTSADSLAPSLRPALEELRQRRLVFEENGRVLSLIRIPVDDTVNGHLAWEREGKALPDVKAAGPRRLPIHAGP